MAEDTTDKIKDLMTQPENIRNMAISAHIDHGKTTLSDSLLAGAGMISEELAGQQLAMDFHEDEQERGITIDSANVNMVHTVDGKDFLINLIDTPGHVDFGGDVTRAMRAVDGTLVLADAVEGMMPQTETVLRQALKEKVKPLLFINKADRLIKELKLTPEQMQERFLGIISRINGFVQDNAPEELKEDWKLSVEDGSVAFGSALHKWALSVPYMKKVGITFKDVIEAYENDTFDELAKKAPAHKVILDQVIEHLPNPKQSQKYRIPKIWHGDMESDQGKALLSCDPKGDVAFVVTKIVIDKHAGEIAAGRLFSGTIKQGDNVYMNMAKKEVRLQQILLYKGAANIQVPEATAGNIIGLVGLKGAFAGETVSLKAIEPFEAIKHIFEPVITKSIEAKTPADLPKLVEVLRQVNKEDPGITVEINEETGENLISGMGELHLEIIENRIISEKGLQVNTSPPIVVYRETVTKVSPEMEGRSPNKHNRFMIIVEPLSDEVYKAMKDGDLPEGRAKKKDKELWKTLQGLGVDSKEARKYVEFYKGNVLVDATRGIVHIGEVIEMVADAFEQVMREGGLAREPGMKMKVRLMDCKLHEDAIHRGPAQVYPAVREAIKSAMLQANLSLFEPLQELQIEGPSNHMSDISTLVQNKRGQLLTMDTEGTTVVARARIPVAEMFGMASDLRSATSGRGVSFVVDQMFEKVPEALKNKVVLQIRDRKGLNKDLSIPV
ncbi:elongation factor EF-2 [archaeon]|nr:elongation factor EF-2 [archaeon]